MPPFHRLLEHLQAEGGAKVLEALAAAEDAARRGHAGLWIHGDPGDESDGDDSYVPRGRF